MTWKEAILKTFQEIFKERKLNSTDVCKQAGFAPNFLTKIAKGDRQKFDVDEVERLAGVLELDGDFIFAEAKKKRMQPAI